VRQRCEAQIVADKVMTLFPTVLFRRHLDGMEETNRQLQALIDHTAATEADASDGKSTEGGYQTREDFLNRDHDVLKTLRGHLMAAIQDYARILFQHECHKQPTTIDFTLWGWAVRYRAGASQIVHVHPRTTISGVYYVAAPPSVLGSGNGGKIIFHDPRPRANMMQLPHQINYYRQAPVPGEIVLFPCWLEHSVPPFQGPGERVCIAFNAQLVNHQA
jgi:uncharacterized protein (TIGR02466 family)